MSEVVFDSYIKSVYGSGTSMEYFDNINGGDIYGDNNIFGGVNAVEILDEIDGALAGKAGIGEQALRLQGIEDGFQRVLAFGQRGQFLVQLRPAVISPGQELQRLDPEVRHRQRQPWSA